METQPSLFNRFKTLILGKERSLQDQTIFHKLSLIAFFAWVGLGADGITSSCYGPPEAFIVLGKHHYLGMFVGLTTVVTIFVIATSYSQIIELFPTGGGGYLVATKLLSPTFGMISGCALLIDYVLTVAVSIASGTDAIFSFLPAAWYPYRLSFALTGVFLLMVLNMRGVKESVVPLVPIFLMFMITHVIAIGYSLTTHFLNIPEVSSAIHHEVQITGSELGFFGMVLLILRSYSMGAGTFTGIEAVSNGLPILREPKVKTAKRTMRYMSVSLAFMVLGLMFSYLLYRVEPQHGKTLNAVLLNAMTSGWGRGSSLFVLITLISEGVLLFVAAQTGFLDGPRVLSNMAIDRWVPTRFSTLSDRLVTQNGILIMGISAALLMVVTGGSVRFLVVLYSINVFITFSLSQLGMVRHWWDSRKSVQHWRKKLIVNGIGLVMTVFILFSVTVLKFNEGGWITVFITGALIAIVLRIKKHYNNTNKMLRRLDDLVSAVGLPNSTASAPKPSKKTPEFDPKAKTAVLFVNGFNGLGLHTLFYIMRKFEGMFKNFIFFQVGVVDAGNFKGIDDIKLVGEHLEDEVDKYVQYMNQHGYYAEAITKIGVDVVDEVLQLAPDILKRFPNAIFFGGQLVFSKDTFILRFLHNYTIFSLQRRLHYKGIPVIIMPIRVN